MSDLPYELLHRARAIIEDGKVDENWIKDFESLPGAELSKQFVRVLRNPDLRCAHNKRVVDKLLEDGYLRKISMVRSRGNLARISVQVRLSRKGQDALRLRSEFDK